MNQYESGQGPVVGSYEQGNEFTAFIDSQEFLISLSWTLTYGVS